MTVNGRIYAQRTWVLRTEGKESGLWPTPTDMSKGGSISRGGTRKDELLLAGAVKKWPTPHANCANGPRNMSQGGDNLQTAAAKYPTPRGSAGGVGMCGGTGSRAMLQGLADANQITEEERKGMQAGNGGQLNPTWVDWLMGYPTGWTDLKDSEMQLSLK